MKKIKNIISISLMLILAITMFDVSCFADGEVVGIISIQKQNEILQDDSTVDLTINWNGASSLLYYIDLYKDDSDEVVASAEATGNSYLFENLETNTKYKIVISPQQGGIKDEANSKELIYSYVVPVISDEFKIQAYPGYKSVTVRWNKIASADSYTIYKSLKMDQGFTELKTNYTTTSYRDKSIEKNTNYYYKVVASGDSLAQPLESKVVSGKMVRPIYNNITFKAGVKLKTHDSQKKKYTYFKRGQTVTAEGFGSGKYRFYYKGRLYHASYVRMKNCRANYLKTTNYTNTTAENFVNEYGRKSKTKYLIWVSTYTQHMYIFKKDSSKKWRVYKNWEVSTGKAASPTPTGFSKKIRKKMRRHSGIDYWCCFQSMNSIHGKRKRYVIGSPHSHGCVRNYNSNAKWIYKHVPVGTSLIVY